MGVIDLDARVKKLEAEQGGGAVIDQLEAAVTALDEEINGNGTTTFGLAGDVNDLKTSNPYSYSTTEKVVGEWIDGSPIYQKTVDTGALPDTDSKDVAHGITNLGFVVDLKGWAIRATDSTMVTLPLVNNAALDNQIQVMVVGSVIRVTTKIDRTAFATSYVTLWYTKSTT